MPQVENEKGLTRLLRDRLTSTDYGYACATEYPVQIQGLLRAMRVDVVGAKWLDEHQLDAIAVECKLGADWEAVGQALNQAIAYQTLFPGVYIAAETSSQDLRHLERVLSELGIGYIQVTEGGMDIRLKPTTGMFQEQEDFHVQVLSKLGRFAACSEYWGEDRTVMRAGEGMSMPYISGMQVEKCNYIYQLPEPGRMRSGVNFESTKYLRKLLNKERADDLLAVLRQLPQDAIFSVYHFSKDKDGRKTPTSRIITESDGSRKPFNKALREFTLGDIQDVAKLAERVKHYVWFLVAKHDDIREIHLTRQRALKEVATLVHEFGPLYDFITQEVIKKIPKKRSGNVHS